MASGPELVATLPPDGGAAYPDGTRERDRAIMRLLREPGNAPPVEWVQLVSSGPQGILRMLVMADVVRLGETDPIRVNLSHPAAQQFADEYECAIVTPKINDLIWDQAPAKITYSNIVPYPEDATAAMVEHSRRIDAKLPPGLPENVLRANLGKSYVNSNLLWQPGNEDRACIYGWHTTDPAIPRPTPGPRDAVTRDGQRVIQPVSVKHWAHFVDYSQTVRYVRREAELADDYSTRVVDLGELAQDPKWCEYISAEGPVILRHPMVTCPTPEAFMGGSVPPVACPVPSGGKPPPPPPSSAAEFPTWPIIVGGVGLALGVAYFATRG